MNRLFKFIKSTIIGGLFFIAPLVLLILIFEKAIKIIRKITAPISDSIEFSFLGGQTTSRIITIVLLLILCLIAGLFSGTKIANNLRDWIEEHILSIIPGYTFIKGVIENATGIESDKIKEVVLVNIEEVWQMGFLVERVDEELNLVYIPGAPNPMSGDLIFVKWERLKLLSLTYNEILKISRTLGVDSKKILNNKISGATFKGD